MNIQEAIQKIRSGEIVCRGNRKTTSDLIELLIDCEKRLSDPTVSNQEPDKESILALKEELFGVESENTKYRKSIEALTEHGNNLSCLVVRMMDTLLRFKSAISVSKSIFKDYDVNEKRVVEAYRTIPDFSSIPQAMKDKFSEYLDMEKKNKEIEDENVSIS